MQINRETALDTVLSLGLVIGVQWAGKEQTMAFRGERPRVFAERQTLSHI